MKLISFKKEENRAHAKLLLDNLDFEDKINVVWNRQKRWFRIPGFRKGKVPKKVIENEYGEDVFYRAALDLCYPEMVDFLINETGEKIIKVEGELYMSISCDAKPEMVKQDENGVEVDLNVNIYPKVDIDYKNMEVAVKPKKVASEEDIDHYLKVMQRRMGLKKMGDDVAIEDGDRIKFDVNSASLLERKDGDEKLNKYLEKFKNLKGMSFEIGSGQSADLDEQLKGHKINDGAFDVDIDIPSNDQFTGGKARVSINVTKVARAHSLEEVAESEGCKDLDELKEKAKEKITDSYEKNYEAEKKYALSQALCDKVSDEMIPQDLLDATVKLNESMTRKQLNLKDDQDLYEYLNSQFGESDFKDEIVRLSKTSLRSLIAINSIAEKNDVSVSDEDIESTKLELKKSQIPVDNIPDSEIKKMALNEKVINSIIGSVKFVDKKVETPSVESQNDVKPDDANPQNS